MAQQRAGQAAGAGQVSQIGALEKGGVPTNQARAGVLNNSLKDVQAGSATTGQGTTTPEIPSAVPRGINVNEGQNLSWLFSRQINNVFSFLGSGARDEAQLEAEVVGTDLRVTTINLLAQDIGGRPTNFSRHRS